MSAASYAYVKHLVTAPNGEKITIAEKAVLLLLSDDHNEDERLAWPSVPNLARRCNMSEKHCRRLLRSLEDKGVIQSTPRLRENGGRSSNFYRFVQIDLPFDAKRVAAVEKRMQLQVAMRANKPVQMKFSPPDTDVRGGGTPKSGGHGRRRGGEADTDVRGGRTPLSPQDPLLDLEEISLVDKGLQKETIPTLPERKGVQISKADSDRWNAFYLALKSDLYSVPASVAKLFQVIKPSPGVIPQNENFDFDVCFRRWWLVEVKRMPNGILLVTEAEDEDATAQGLEKYKRRLQETAKRYFSPKDKKLPITFKLLRSTRPQRVMAAALVGSLAASSEEAAAAVAGMKRGAWGAVQIRLKELLEQRRDKLDSLRNYRDAIEPVTLKREATEDGMTVWYLQPRHQKKTQAVMSLFRRELDAAIRDVMGRSVRLKLLGT